MPVFNRFYLLNGQISPLTLTSSGPTFPVEIHLPIPLTTFLANQNQQIPQPVSGLALFDTGASMTCVDDSIIQSLGVSPVGQGNVSTPSGHAQQSLYPARLVFPTLNYTLDFNAVFGAQLKSQNIIALVGRDVLQNAVMTYNGPGGFVTIGF